MAQGDTARREAFAALFSQMAPRLYRTALGLLGNPHDAADALQEAGMRAFRYFDGLRQPEAAAAWLTRILVNVCHDRGRLRSRSVPVGLEPMAEAEQAVQPETDWELMDLLRHLPDEQRMTVALRFFHDLSISQIARVLEVPEGTVKSRLHTALGRLRSRLSENRREGAQ